MRAQRAKRAVLSSRVHAHDLLDQQRNDSELPVQEWEIAADLRTYTRLLKEAPKPPATRTAKKAHARRSEALELSLEHITRRVLALESYARAAREADARYEEALQAEQMTDDHDEVLDLLARAARSDLAVTELAELSAQASAVTSAFTDALDATKQAGVIALSERRKTA